MQPFDHLDHLRSLRNDPRAVPYFIDRAHRLRAEAYADAWRWLVGRMRRIFRLAAHRPLTNTYLTAGDSGARPTADLERSCCV